MYKSRARSRGRLLVAAACMLAAVHAHADTPTLDKARSLLASGNAREAYIQHVLNDGTLKFAAPVAGTSGTPGRIRDHLSRKTLDLSSIRTLVLDHATRHVELGVGSGVTFGGHAAVRDVEEVVGAHHQLHATPVGRVGVEHLVVDPQEAALARLLARPAGPRGRGPPRPW